MSNDGTGSSRVPKKNEHADDGGPGNEKFDCTEYRRNVLVLGAGITGLTAAHELAERGFGVTVVDRTPPSVGELLYRLQGRFLGEAGEVLQTALAADNWWQSLLDESKPLADIISESLGPDVGGIARTQWPTLPEEECITPWSGNTGNKLPLKPFPPMASPVVTDRPDPYDPTSDVRVGTVEPDPDANDPGAQTKQWRKFLQDARDVIQSKVDGEELSTVVLVPVLYVDATSEDRQASEQRAIRSARRMLETVYSSGGELSASLVERIAPFIAVEWTDGPPSADMGFRVVLGRRLVPAEHGYRFFAGFYRHVRDTMKRTPIWDRRLGRFTKRRTHDNLGEVPWQSIADPVRPFTTAFRRKPPRTLGEAMQQYRRLQRELGYRPSDMLRFMLRLLRFATSSTERRAGCYENLTWWDFLSLRDLRSCPDSLAIVDDVAQGNPEPERLPYGVRAEDALNFAPQALVAMRGDAADARTQGNITLQLVMDNLGLSEMTDSTLNGPTSEAWFHHWRDYLERQGVSFVYGLPHRLVRRVVTRTIETTPTPPPLPPNCIPIGERLCLTFENAVPGQLQDQTFHYVVVATDPLGAGELSQELDAPWPVALREYVQSDQGDPRTDVVTQAATGRRFERYQTITGIQLFYASKVGAADSHIYYARSPWGLSAVSQYQYWRPYLSGGTTRFLGNLSIDLGRWDPTPDPSQLWPEGFRLPNTYGRVGLADAVERQIHRCSGQLMQGRQPTWLYSYIDAYIEFGANGLPQRNLYPYLINPVSDWAHRPAGDPWSPSDPIGWLRIPGSSLDEGGDDLWRRWRPLRAWESPVNDMHGVPDGYPILYGSLVYAGIYMRTFTRLNSMEKANESARHAVNAILDHLTFLHAEGDKTRLVPEGTDLERWAGGPSETAAPHYAPTPFGDYCQIWNPERHEPVDLEFMKQIDACLFRGAEDTSTEPYPMDAPSGPPPQGPDRPHLFDLLRIDELADYVETDAQMDRVLEILSSCACELRLVDMQSTNQLWGAITAARDRILDVMASYRSGGARA